MDKIPAHIQPLMTVAKRYPLLSAHSERNVAVAARDGDRDARYALVLHNLRFAADEAFTYGSNLVPLEDLLSAAICGLITAAGRYDPDHPSGARFPSYARSWIRQQMNAEATIFASDLTTNPRALGIAKKIQDAAEAHHVATADEIAHASGLSRITVRSHAGLNYGAVPLDDDQGGEIDFHDIIPGDGAASVSLASTVRHLLEYLRDQYPLGHEAFLLYTGYPDGGRRTQAMVAAALGVSRQAIGYRLDMSKRILREYLQETGTAVA